MKSEKMYGVFTFQEKDYPFILEKQILTIPQVPLQYKDDFEGINHIEEIHGVTNSNRNVVFLGCEVLNAGSFFSFMEVKLSILGYIILQNDKTTFDKIEFYSEGINGFYSPRNAYQIEDDGQMRGTGIKLRDAETYRRNYECKILGEEINIGLNIFTSLNLAFERNVMGTAESLLSVSFGKKKQPHDILKYSLYIMDFLEFINFQKNIPLEKITLYWKNNDGKYQPCGKAVVFQAENDQYSPSAMRSITFPDITEECFPILFSQIAERRESKRFNPFFYPENRRADRVIDASKWLNNAICFEGAFDDAFPEYKAQHDTAFCEVKTYLLNTIDSAVEKTNKSINNRQNSAWKRFRKMIQNADTTIQEKFEACQVEFEEETKVAIQRIRNKYDIQETVNLAESYSSFRNQTAHGTIKKPGNEEIATYQILRCFVYAMNLKRAGVPSKNISAIIMKLFQ